MAKPKPSTGDLFETPPRPVEYEVHYHPPEYPEKCFPSRCNHPPEYSFAGDVHLVPAKKGGGRVIEIDHAVCLGCGSTQPCTIGGNILVDLTMILADKGARHWKIALRAQHLRDKWSRIATYLFDADGWNGRHERIARLIDPNLTMRLTLERVGGTSTRMGTIKFDPSYLRWDEVD